MTADDRILLLEDRLLRVEQRLRQLETNVLFAGAALMTPVDGRDEQ